MKYFKKIAEHIINVNAALAIILAIISTAALIYVFLTEQLETITAYCIYALTTYFYTVFGFAVPRIIIRIKAIIYKNKLGNRFMTDIPFRIKVALYLSLIFNILYAVLKLTAGIYYASFWVGADAVYYLILSVAQFLLLRYIRKNKRNKEREYRQYRFCGVLLFMLNVALIVFVYQIIHTGRSYHYPGLFIYIFATYTFICITVAIVNAVKFRKYKNPIYSAQKAIALSKALVSVFVLQTAMFVSFGDGEEAEKLAGIMNIITGTMICITIFGMAVLMVVTANERLKKIKGEHSQ